MKYDEGAGGSHPPGSDCKSPGAYRWSGVPGKTTTTQGIIAAYRTFGLNILLAAPTGRAAKRMTEATGYGGENPSTDFWNSNRRKAIRKNEETPLEGDVLIVDECSMIDIVLMNALMKAIPPHMRLILVGDIDQLPSVGAGNVLRDVNRQ